MQSLSCKWVTALLVVFTIFLVRAWLLDRARDLDRANCALDIQNRDTNEGFHAAVVTTIKDESTHGTLSQSKVQHMLNVTRDQVIRGIIMGAITGGASDAIHSAVTWSLVGGVVSGFSDLLSFS